MISTAQVERVRRLLARGELSQRQIARHLHLSRNTVNAIARGDRPNCRGGPGASPCIKAPVRCRGCGGWVYRPCQVCRQRGIRERQLRMVMLEPRRKTCPAKIDRPYPVQSCG